MIQKYLFRILKSSAVCETAWFSHRFDALEAITNLLKSDAYRKFTWSQPGTTATIPESDGNGCYDPAIFCFVIFVAGESHMIQLSVPVRNDKS
jgi:hypothetical protein